MKQMTASLRTTLTVFALFLGLITALPSLAQNQTPRINIPVLGSGPGSTFTGNLAITRFVQTATGGVAAVGTLTGLLTNTATGAVTSVMQTVSAPAAVTQTACDILNLDLGPLHLNLLGLVVDLNEVILNITAQPGAGNLLGNLLCSITGLLDSPGGLARVLNQILGLLG
jgi:hypothetical protein